MIEVYYPTLFNTNGLLYFKDKEFLWSDNLLRGWQEYVNNDEKFKRLYVKLFEISE